MTYMPALPAPENGDVPVYQDGEWTVGPGGVADAVTSTTISEIITLTQGEYDALPEPDPTVLYVVTE